VSIYVAESVMDAASIVPEEDMDAERTDTDARLSQSPFGDLIDNLDLDDLGPEDK